MRKLLLGIVLLLFTLAAFGQGIAVRTDANKSVVAGGFSATMTGSGNSILGGSLNVVKESPLYSALIGGTSNTNSNPNGNTIGGVILGGSQNLNSGIYGLIGSSFNCTNLNLDGNGTMFACENCLMDGGITLMAATAFSYDGTDNNFIATGYSNSCLAYSSAVIGSFNSCGMSGLGDFYVFQIGTRNTNGDSAVVHNDIIQIGYGNLATNASEMIQVGINLSNATPNTVQIGTAQANVKFDSTSSATFIGSILVPDITIHSNIPSTVAMVNGDLRLWSSNGVAYLIQRSAAGSVTTNKIGL